MRLHINTSVSFRTAAEPVATELVFDHSGRLARSKKVARAVGTTVAVAKLFSPLPVRYREFTRNVKREYGKLLTLLQVGASV
jgi:DNA mismatch repair protein PMS2